MWSFVFFVFFFKGESVGKNISGTGDKKVATQTFLERSRKIRIQWDQKERSEREQERAMEHGRQPLAGSEQREDGHSKDHSESWTQTECGGQGLNGSEERGGEAR